MGDFIVFKFVSLTSSAPLPPVPSPAGSSGGCLTGIQGSDSGPHTPRGEIFRRIM